METISGINNGKGLKIALVASRFNQTISQRLVDGARVYLMENGVSENDITLVWVPGAFEISQMVKVLLDKGGFSGIVPLGCVIRGETSHYDYVCGAAADGIAALARQSDIPVSFGVLTVENRSQAEARSGGAKGNKGRDAAEAVLELRHSMDHFR